MYATLKIPKKDNEQIDHIYKAREYLAKAGITFDSGVNLIDNLFDWEFDWSLKGAKFYEEDKEIIFNLFPKNEKRINNILNAELELTHAGLWFKTGYDSKKRRVWNFSKADGCEIVIRNK